MDYTNLFKNIADSLYAIEKIKNIRNSSTREQADNISRITDIINTMTPFYPGDKRKQLENAAYFSNLYGNAYRNLKYHVLENRSRELSIDYILKALAALKPMLRSNHIAMLDKMTKIYEIIIS
ncbi:MAG: hypothetical protein Q8920_17550 [Bacillota bacterium]|nr:hypothetical protein [Bacillota bacterium]